MSQPSSTWTDRRQGYRYAGVLFSDDGRELRQDGRLYRECAFPARAERRFRVWLAVVLLGTLPARTESSGAGPRSQCRA